MQELLKAGTTVVVDRYSYSGVAFSAAKEGMDVDWCFAPEKGLPAPDAIIYLDLPIEKAMLRGQFGEERYEKENFQRLVRDNFFEMMKQGDKDLWNVIDADQTIEEVEAQIHEIVAKVVGAVAGKPIGFL
jgi:dTMP kinase